MSSQCSQDLPLSTSLSSLIICVYNLQAAKDTGDKQIQWQAMEGLGAVAFTDGNYEKAGRFFKQAITLIGETGASDRRVLIFFFFFVMFLLSI